MKEPIYMGNDLILGGYGQPEERRGWLSPKQSAVQREFQQREERASAELLFNARKQQATAALRMHLTETAMHDVTDMVSLARQLAGGDPLLAQELGKLVAEFNRQTARDIRSFGNGLGL
ncbi:hypothetical protein OG496_12330 [Streptomyces sp. NBC_00988]|uniref:hypothetical protein n=1 Tax=Streptomyces sp. NBC_00988 TaxID=2903704 RepID=UPI0038647D54|nr:hypothetical protein OG496_12330 [Streptomyces sp. NBC_00988]